MKKEQVWAIGLFILGVLAAGVPSRAQGNDMAKPPMYIYVSQWAVPRAQWGEMAKSNAADVALSEKLVTGGTLTGFGDFESLIHTQGQPTHGSWLTANSQEGIVKAVDAFMSQAGATAPVLAASKHWDHFLVSRTHNFRSGKFEDAYLAGSMWKVKPGQMQAFEAMVKARVVPLLEKGLSDGTVIFYSVDTEDYHTDAPGLVDVVFAVTDATAMDKVNAAFEANFSKDTEIGPALGALTVRDSHRDFLYSITQLVIK